ncbi:MAG: hypothetical protein Q8P60_06495 [Pseudorhodobacter sp.]|nr:hypothetical protein [Pseudorhodobacter sp.]
MPSIRTLLARVQRLESARIATPSPFVQLYGSVDGFAEGAEGLDRVDFPLVLAALRRWEADGVWGRWQRGRNRMWEKGA